MAATPQTTGGRSSTRTVRCSISEAHRTRGYVLEAVLTSPDGDVAHWAVTAEVDPFGNRVDYHYTVQSDPGKLGSTEPGTAIYPSYIAYTGHDGVEGPFRVTFLRDRELNEARRPDVEMEGLLGFKTVTADLLRRIVITYGEEPVRAYELTYETGLYRRSLLHAIAEIDADGEEFYRHTFEYHDEVTVGGELRPFGPEETWDSGDDDLTGPMINPLPGFSNEASVLGTSTSGSIQVGTAITFGPVGSPVTKDYTVGGTVGFGQNEAEGLLALVDINGDALPDKVFRRGEALYYRPNTGESAFGAVRPIRGITSFSYTKVSELNFGAEANIAPLFAGYEYTTSTSTTSTYFADFNGDDLIDVVVRGQVYFNHLDANGDPVFTTDSNDTNSPIVAGAAPDPNLVTVDPDEQADLLARNPLHDVVRCWQAPWSGIVTINAPLHLVDTDPYPRADGVRVSIQHGGTVRYARDIEAGDFTTYFPDGVANISVRSGDRIYFRVQSVVDGAHDRVAWDPEIYYLGSDTSLLDPNGKAYYRFQASEDFLLASIQEVSMPERGLIDIEGTISKPVLTDTLILRILETRGGNRGILRTDTLLPNTVLVNEPIEISGVSVDTSVSLCFQLGSASEVSWQDIRWQPTISFRSGGYVYCPAIDYTLFPRMELAAVPVVVPDPGSYYLAVRYLPGVAVPSQPQATIKVRDSLVARFPLQRAGTGLTLGAYVTLPADAEVFVEVFEPSSFGGGSVIASLQDSLSRARGAGGKISVQAGLARKLTQRELLFGNGYRGWGQFVYNGNGAAGGRPIDESLLRRREVTIDSSDLEEIENIDPEDEAAIARLADKGGDPTKDQFVVMIADPKAGNWRGYDNLTLVGPDYLSSSRFGEDDVVLTPDLGDGSSSAPGLISKSSMHAVAGGVSAGIGSLGASYANNTTHSVIDVTDMNGDRYPDLVTETRIQYTGPYGGLDGTSLSHTLGSHTAHSKAIGATAGGNFVHSSTSNAGASHGKGSRRRSRKARNTSRNNGSRASSSNESGESAASISGNFTEDRDYAEHSWQDMNGDGLPDKVWQDGTVALNYGYRFGAPEAWAFTEITSGVSYDYGGGVGINVSNGSIMAGVGVSRTDNWTEQWLQDINGDGLTDRLRYDEDGGTLTANLNHGTDFGPDLVWETDAPRAEEGNASSESVNGAFTICVNILLVRVCFNPSGSTGRGISRTLTQYTDIDGDGVPESVRAGTDDGSLLVRPSKLGKSNLLKTIHGPLGAEVRVDYARAPLTYEMPHAQYVLYEVAVSDGVSGDGPDWRRARFSFAEPVYDRYEREFYGYRSVREDHLNTENDGEVYRSLVREYRQSNYYTKGLLSEDYVVDAQGRRFGTTRYRYTLLDPATMDPVPAAILLGTARPVFPALTEIATVFQEGDSTRSITETETYDYTDYGLMSRTVNTGNGRPEDLLEINITYQQFTDRYLHGAKSEVLTYGGGELLRKETTTYFPEGKPRELTLFIDDTLTSTEVYEYDAFGNLTKETGPRTAAGERMILTYGYDEQTHTHLTNYTNGHGLVATATFDPKFGQQTSFVGLQGQHIDFELDRRGRVTSVLRPLDPIYSYRYHYFPDAEVPYALTERYDPATGQPMVYYDFVDGYARRVQRKEQTVIGGDPNPKLVVSGRIRYDAFDRVVASHYPTVTELADGPLYQIGSAPETPYRKEYDVLDRPTIMTEPNAVTSTLNYRIEEIPGGELMIAHLLSDGLGNQSATYTTGSGQLEALWTETGGQKHWTVQRYNALGEHVSTLNPAGCESKNEYDRLGRLVREKPCDSGVTEYFYDAADLLTAKVTPNLRAWNPQSPPRIKYTYDLDRLVRIDYPKNYQNRVELAYGEADAPHNRAGRVWLSKDATGGEEFFYDINGNVTKSIRTLLINESAVRTFVTESRYDSWGRLTQIVYPDGERVDYTFNADGRPVSMRGTRDSVSYSYLKNVEFDRFGAMTAQVMGNGLRHEYAYDPVTRRLNSYSMGDHLRTRYLLNNVGNPTTIEQTGDLGSAFHQYDYDESQQLTEAFGQWEGEGFSRSYSYFVDYENAYAPGNQELQLVQSTDTVSRKLIYSYDMATPNQPTEVSGRRFDFDANGNQLGYAGQRGSFRFARYRWDEEDRLVASSTEGGTVQYTYSADGRRAVESSARTSGIFTNGAPTGVVLHGNDYRAYVNPFLTARQDGFTKHYWYNSQRIASKEGTGEFNNFYWFGRGLTAGDENYTARIQDLTATVWNYYGDLGIPPGPPTLPGYYAQPERTGAALPSAAPNSFTHPPTGWPVSSPRPDPSAPPGAPTVSAQSTLPRDSIGAGYGFESFRAFPEAEIRFYSPDPMGNIQLVTDINGKVLQYHRYLPTGERIDGAGHPNYGFNGKEETRDGELTYFGARYYDLETGLFLNQDPHAEDYPGFNPYAFGLNNPLSNSDPDGRDPIKLFNSPREVAIEFAMIYNKKSFLVNREFGANIYRTTVSGRKAYFYEANVVLGDPDGVALSNDVYDGAFVGHIHTHGMMAREGDGAGAQFGDGFNIFSDVDIEVYQSLAKKEQRKFRGYMVNPRGDLLQYTAYPGDKDLGKLRKHKKVAGHLPFDDGYFEKGGPDGALIRKSDTQDSRRRSAAAKRVKKVYQPAGLLNVVIDKRKDRYRGKSRRPPPPRD